MFRNYRQKLNENAQSCGIYYRYEHGETKINKIYSQLRK